jgi:hypothetical protein
MSHAWWALRLQAAETAFENGECDDLLILFDEMLDGASRDLDPQAAHEAREHLTRARRYAQADDLGLSRAAYVKALHHLP